MFGNLFGGAKRRTMRKKACPKCHHKPCACKKRSMKKGSASKTRKGRKNFITHKGDKDYNARGHRQVRRNAPYMKRRGGGSCGNHANETAAVSGGNPTNPLNPLAGDESQSGGKRRRSRRRRSHKKRTHRRRH